MVAILSLFFVMPVTPHKIEPLFLFDGYSLLFMGIIFFASLLITVQSYIYLNQHRGEREEYFIILFVAALGAAILTAANHFVTFFLGIETLSVSLYILIAYLRSRDYSIEAGVKYLILASVSAAFLLFGMALIYTGTGTMNFEGIAAFLKSSGNMSPVVMAGIGMIIVGIGFKLALVPFHMWTPDVYQGAPAPVTAFIATVSKGAVMALILRFFINIRGFDNNAMIVIISVIAVLSMFIGNLLALRQNNVKRLLAYSSIAHLGYLAITLLTGGEYGIPAAIFYLVSYIMTSLGAFGVISLLSDSKQDAEHLEDYRGLFWKHPWIASIFTLSMLSLAGIPLTAGFMAKFYLVLAGVKSGLWLLAFSLIINSVIGLYYYLRIITTMFSSGNKEKLASIPFAGNFVLAVIALVILVMGVTPAWFMDIIMRFSELR
jgi:NADH-quinone oxidoreductase subunit N